MSSTMSETVQAYVEFLDEHTEIQEFRSTMMGR
jgi:hypothetical protein